MALLVPTANQCLAFAAPFVAGGVIVGIWRHGDEWIARLFPQLGWERELGWLNLRAHRRAERILRLLTHALHLALLGALVGILTLGWLLGQPHDTSDLMGLLGIPFELIWFALSLGLWVAYFAYVLAPRVRAEFEEQELVRWRAEHPEEEQPQRKRASRSAISLWDAERPRRS